MSIIPKVNGIRQQIYTSGPNISRQDNGSARSSKNNKDSRIESPQPPRPSLSIKADDQKATITLDAYEKGKREMTTPMWFEHMPPKRLDY